MCRASSELSFDSSLEPPGAALTPTVFFFCRLGDMVMVTRMLNLLHQRYGRPCQVIGTGSWTPATYAGNPDVAGVWAFHRHLPFLLDAAWRPMRRALRESAPGPIYICERHYRQLPRIRRMLRLAGADPRRCVFLSERPVKGPVRETDHLVDRLLALGARTPANLRAEDYPVREAAALDGPRLYVLESERAERDAWLRAQGYAGRELILVQPGNHRTMGPRRARWRRLNTDDKWWPIERWVELLQRMHREHPDAVLLLRGSQEELPLLQEIQAETGVKSVGTVGTTLRQLYALCEAASSMVSVDSGPGHAAAALSVPLVVLYGAESPLYWLPRSPSGSPVVGVGGPPTSRRADQVSVDTVFDAWCAMARYRRA
ncbi:MAG TPA: glycosyltransferase family 9 protein [Steroidobacteraceae bacterium]|nr:glycosyltransferase family 9 protein [Steroidobacteraceae bacterium]